MAELLAVAAAVATVSQLSKMANDLARALYQFARDARAAKKEARRFADKVRLFFDTIVMAIASLNRHCSEYKDSQVVKYISTYSVLEQIVKESDLVRNRLEKARNKVVKFMESSSKLWMSIRWGFSKSSILELSPEMESVKASLSVLMATALLEAVIESRKKKPQASKEENNSILEEIGLLKGVIKSHLKVIYRLHSKSDRVDNFRERAQGDVESFASSGLGQQDALFKLGQSMRKYDEVPEELPSPPLTPKCSRRRDSGPANGPGGLQETPGMATVSPPFDPSSSSSPAFISPSRLDQRPPDPLEDNPLPPSAQEAKLTSSSTEARPFSKILRFYSSDFGETTTGYIVTRSSSGPVTAAVARNAGGNMITVKEAARLGLISRSLRMGSADGVTFQFGPHTSERSVGKVTLQWRKSKDDNPLYPPLTVECEVCNHYEPGLIFGRPFLDERSRLWGKENTGTN